MLVVGVIVATVLLVCLLFCFTVVSVERDRRPRTHAVQQRFTQAVSWCRWLYHRVGLRSKLKILISFYQIATVLDSTYSVALPDVYVRWTDAFRFISDIRWASVAIPAECWLNSYENQLIATATGPLVLVGVILLVSVAWCSAKELWTRAKVCSNCVGSSSPQGGIRPHLLAGAHKGLLACLPIMTMIVFVFVSFK